MNSSLVQPVLALLGYPIVGNPNQYVVEQALLHHQLDCRYLSFEVPPEKLGDAIRGMQAMGFRGGNCASPHQAAVLEFLPRLTPAAEFAGAVNCIYRDGETLVGENTEGKAFLEALRRRLDPAGKRIVLLGTGHTARAIAIELAPTRPAEIALVTPDEESGRLLVEVLLNKFQVQASLLAFQDGVTLPADVSILVDADPSNPTAPSIAALLAPEAIPGEMVVADVAFNPPHARFLHEAAEKGCRTIDGLEIFIDQTALNFRLWMGTDPDRAVLRDAAEEFLEL